jgi:hypothetical protein
MSQNKKPTMSENVLRFETISQRPNTSNERANTWPKQCGQLWPLFMGFFFSS